MGQISVDAGLISATLDTIEEVETLVRIVGNICFARDLASGTNGDVAVYILLNPHGVRIPATMFDLQTGGTFEGRDANAILWHGALCVHQQYDKQYVEIDVKGMRKLEEGDVIEIYTHGQALNMGYVNFFFTLFYKKA